jgi:hypothetical protein
MKSSPTLIVLLLLLGCDRAEPNPAPIKDRLDVAAVNEATWQDVVALECKPARLDACGADGCKMSEPVVTVRWEPKGVYQRCDLKGCDSYQPEVSYSGIWTEISLPKNGLLMKVSAEGEYIEIATINDTALVYRGQCTRLKMR